MILETALIISGFCLGLRTMMGEGMLLHFIRKPFESSNKAILKPLILCVVCFPSFYGTILYIALNGLEWQIIPTLFISVFINKILWSISESYF